MENHREKNIRTAILLNVSFTLIEVVGGLWTNSLAILSDALHDFGDSIALIISWIAERQALRPADRRRTFGYGRLSLFAAFFTGMVLVTGSLIILAVAARRLLHPEHANASGMMGLAVLGIVFNALGFFRLKQGMSMNEKVLSWHFLEDVFGWVVILAGAVIIRFWDNHFIDPIMTIGFTLFILWGVAKNLRETANIFLQGVPGHIDIEEVERALLSVDGVKGVHDIHIWSMDGERNVFTGHVVVDHNLWENPDGTRRDLKEILRRQRVEHSTIELETEYFCSGIDCAGVFGR